MKRIALLSAAFCSLGLQAQTLLCQARPAGSDLWGYMDIKGNMVIPPTYKNCFPFGESGYAAVRDLATDKPQFINAKGEALKTDPADFALITGLFGGRDAQGFTCDRAPVKVGKLWGFMGTDGKMAIAPKYDRVDPFEGCHAVVFLGKTQYILTADGKEVPVSDPNIVDVKGFKNGLSPFKLKDGMHGFMDATQSVVIPPQFLGVGYFTGELAWAKTKEGKVGYINRKGEWAIPAQFDAGEDFDGASGMARVKQGGAWMYVSRDGSIMRMTDTQSWGDFTEGLAKGKKGELFGFFDKTGAWVILPQFQNVREFKNGYAAARQGDKWGFIDRTGKWVIEPKFEVVKDMERAGS